MAFPLDHVVIYTADAQASGRYYERLLGWLGFEKRRDHVFAREGLFIDLRQATTESPAYARGRRGVDHMGFRARSRQEVDELAAHMRSASYEGRLIEFDTGDYALFLSDPDGVRVELTCYADPDRDPVD